MFAFITYEKITIKTAEQNLFLLINNDAKSVFRETKCTQVKLFLSINFIFKMVDASFLLHFWIGFTLRNH